MRAAHSPSAMPEGAERYLRMPSYSVWRVGVLLPEQAQVELEHVAQRHAAGDDEHPFRDLIGQRALAQGGQLVNVFQQALMQKGFVWRSR